VGSEPLRDQIRITWNKENISGDGNRTWFVVVAARTTRPLYNHLTRGIDRWYGKLENFHSGRDSNTQPTTEEAPPTSRSLVSEGRCPAIWRHFRWLMAFIKTLRKKWNTRVHNKWMDKSCPWSTVFFTRLSFELESKIKIGRFSCWLLPFCMCIKND